MIIDATFWVSISFFIFCIALIYLKVPQKVNSFLKFKIDEIKKEIDEAEKLKNEAKNILIENQNQLLKAKKQTEDIIESAKKDTEKYIVEQTEKFYKQMEIKKKNTEEKLKRMQENALNDVKNISIKLSFQVIENLLKNSIDKDKLNNIYDENLKQTKIAFKKINT